MSRLANEEFLLGGGVVTSPSHATSVELVGNDLQEIRVAVIENDWPLAGALGLRLVGSARVLGTELAAAAVRAPSIRNRFLTAMNDVLATSVQLAADPDTAGIVSNLHGVIQQATGAPPELEKGFAALVAGDFDAAKEAFAGLDASIPSEASALNDHLVDLAAAARTRGLVTTMHSRVNRIDLQDGEQDIFEIDQGETALADSQQLVESLTEWHQHALDRFGTTLDEGRRPRSLLAEIEAHSVDDLNVIADHANVLQALAGRSTQNGQSSVVVEALAIGTDLHRLARSLIALELAVSHTATVGPDSPDLERLRSCKRDRKGPFPNAPDQAIGALSESQGRVEIRGRVSGRAGGRSDGKLVGRIEVSDPVSDESVTAVVVFVNPQTRGVEVGAGLRATGSFTNSSPLNGGAPAFEVERLSLTTLSERRFEAAIAQLVAPWFAYWPNNHNLMVSVTGTKLFGVNGTLDPTSPAGAGELVFPPFVRDKE